MIGVMRSPMNALSRAANTAPMTKATASSTRFPRIRNVLKSCTRLTTRGSFTLEPLSLLRGGPAEDLVDVDRRRLGDRVHDRPGHVLGHQRRLGLVAEERG